MNRSLYQCGNARCRGDKIACSEGHALSNSKDGTVAMNRLQRGEPLELKACQECGEYDHMGDAVPKEERGWLKGGE